MSTQILKQINLNFVGSVREIGGVYENPPNPRQGESSLIKHVMTSSLKIVEKFWEWNHIPRIYELLLALRKF